MKPRPSIVACAAAALAALFMGWLALPRPPSVLPTPPALRPVGLMEEPRLGASSRSRWPALESTLQAGWSRAEAARHLQQFFSRELLRQELELEQVRYRGQYWEAEPGLAELKEIETRRREITERLASEMNGLLAEVAAGESGEPITLAAFFDLDRPAPNVAFLSPDSREKIEEALLARGAELDVARILSGQELTDYMNWNAPSSAALRNQLAGFAPDEQEFAVILEWQAAAGSGQEASARTELERRLGPERLAALDWQTRPEVSTALQDLRRLGLPLDQAAWLADFRGQAAGQLQRAWTDPWLTESQQQARVRLLEEAFRAELADQLALPAGSQSLLP